MSIVVKGEEADKVSRAKDNLLYQSFVRLYQQAGPSSLCATVLPSGFMFGYDGVMALLIGQRVSTEFAWSPSDQDRKRWTYHQQQIRQRAQSALPMRQALKHVIGKSA